MGIVQIENSSYHMHDELIKKWNNLKDGKLKKFDEDRAYIVDGRERVGKSLFTTQQGAYIDPEMLEDQKDGKILSRIPLPENYKQKKITWESNTEWKREAIRRYKRGMLLPQITFNAKETLRAIRFYKSDEKRTKNIIFDEAFRGMSSKGVLSKENKKLVQALMEMGQSNLVLWIVSPSFFLLELYPAIIRSNALFHVKKDKKSGKRIVRIFNFRKKAMLYQIGIRKGWSYNLPTRQRVNFYNKYPLGDDFEWRYRLKKQLSLHEIDIEEEKEEHRYKIQRDSLIKNLYLEMKSLRKASEWMKKAGVTMSPTQIGYLMKKKKKSDDDLLLETDNID